MSRAGTLPGCSVCIAVYTSSHEAVAGGSQAVRLPHECRFPDDQREVIARRQGRTVILEPADEWPDAFRACLGAWPEEIPRPPQRKVRHAGDPFR